MEHQDVLQRARLLAEERRPDASAQKHAAFANSVAEMVTGVSGGYGGPSVREHVVGRMYGSVRCSFEEATELLLDDKGPIFGPLTEQHEFCWDSDESGCYCFDDDPLDVEELVSRTGFVQ